MDKEKVISLVEDAIEIVEKEAFWTIANGLRDALAMLKEQENEEERILKIVWDVLHGCVSTDTVADQDYVYEKIRNRVHPMY